MCETLLWYRSKLLSASAGETRNYYLRIVCYSEMPYSYSKLQFKRVGARTLIRNLMVGNPRHVHAFDTDLSVARVAELLGNKDP